MASTVWLAGRSDTVPSYPKAFGTIARSTGVSAANRQFRTRTPTIVVSISGGQELGVITRGRRSSSGGVQVLASAATCSPERRSFTSPTVEPNHT